MMGSKSFPISVDDDESPPYREREYDDFSVKQRVFRTSSFRTEYKQADPIPLTAGEKVKNAAKKTCSCSDGRGKKLLQKLLPIFKIYRKYKIKTDLPNDAIAGFTVGIMQLPQGMAYAMLADLPPVVGLYMSFFPVLIYFLLGTSRHISMGTVAVVSLMTGSIVSKVTTSSLSSSTVSPLSSTAEPSLNFTESFNGTTLAPDTGSGLSDLDVQKIALASTMCFLVGAIQVLFGVCRLGFVTTYMSDPLVSGFTTGAAVHVFTSQVKYIFGLKIPRYPNLLQIVYTYKAIILNLPKTNIPTLIASAICIVILYIVKVQINTRFKHKLKIPVPIELLVVVTATLLSHFFKFNETYNMKVVGKIPAGLPPITPPAFVGFSDYISDAIIIAVVAFAQSVSLAALMAKKHNYTIDSNQEFIAYGAGSIFGSFFSCYPFAASVSRSSVQDSAGGRTQVASLFSASLVLVVIIVIGPLFESLPSCVLASIIVVALRSMFLQVFELKKLWRVSGYDFFIWIITFVAVVILYVDLGLWIGLIFSFLTVVIRTQFTKPVQLQRIADLDVFADENKYLKTQRYPGVLIVGFHSPMYYANADIFVKQVYQLSQLKPERARKQIKRLGSIQEFRRSFSQTSQAPLYDPNPTSPSNGQYKRQDSIISISSFGVTANGHVGMSHPHPEDCQYLHHIVIDCSSMCFMDSVGSKVMKQLFDEYKTIGIKVFLAAVQDDVWTVLDTTGFLDSYKQNIYLSVADAVSAAMDDPEDEIVTKQNTRKDTSKNNNVPTIIEETEPHPEDSLLQVT